MMTDFLDSLIRQASGDAAEVRPQLPALFAPWQGLPDSEPPHEVQASDGSDAPFAGSAYFATPLVYSTHPAVAAPLPTLRQMAQLQPAPNPKVHQGRPVAALASQERTSIEPGEAQQPVVEPGPPQPAILSNPTRPAAFIQPEEVSPTGLSSQRGNRLPQVSPGTENAPPTDPGQKPEARLRIAPNQEQPAHATGEAGKGSDPELPIRAETAEAHPGPFEGRAPTSMVRPQADKPLPEPPERAEMYAKLTASQTQPDAEQMEPAKSQPAPVVQRAVTSPVGTTSAQPVLPAIRPEPEQSRPETETLTQPLIPAGNSVQPVAGWPERGPAAQEFTPEPVSEPRTMPAAQELGVNINWPEPLVQQANPTPPPQLVSNRAGQAQEKAGTTPDEPSLESDAAQPQPAENRPAPSELHPTPPRLSAAGPVVQRQALPESPAAAPAAAPAGVTAALPGPQTAPLAAGIQPIEMGAVAPIQPPASLPIAPALAIQKLSHSVPGWEMPAIVPVPEPSSWKGEAAANREGSREAGSPTGRPFAKSSEPLPTVHVSISRVVVRAAPAGETPPSRAVELPKPPLSLRDYLKGKQGGTR